MVAPAAVRFTDPPLQMVAVVGVTVTTGGAPEEPTLTVYTCDGVQDNPSFTVTV